MIEYIDRKSGSKVVEKVYGEKFLRILYGESLFARLLSYTLLPLIAKFPFASRLYGYLMKRPASRLRIEPFIKEYHIDASEFAPATFSSFNDFFIRKLKPEARPIDSDPSHLICPADGRYSVYPKFSRLFVKGQEFSLPQFLQNLGYGRRYEEGSMAIIRLCPTDYHRFHFPCDGIAFDPHLINGGLYSVNPIALRKQIKILSENKRVVTEIETAQFGTILYAEVGATSVGSIRQTFSPNAPVKKGQEKGYFEFGGSCLVLLFEKGCIQFDADLIENTKNGLETLCQLGTSLGRSRLSST